MEIGKKLFLANQVPVHQNTKQKMDLIPKIEYYSCRSLKLSNIRLFLRLNRIASVKKCYFKSKNHFCKFKLHIYSPCHFAILLYHFPQTKASSAYDDDWKRSAFVGYRHSVEALWSMAVVPQKNLLLYCYWNNSRFPARRTPNFARKRCTPCVATSNSLAVKESNISIHSDLEKTEGH